MGTSKPAKSPSKVDFPEPEAPADTVPAEPAADTFAATGAPADAADEPVPAGGGDRIDDLLRQFRERYGRE